MKRHQLAIQSLATALLLGTWASAADWPQFRHDSNRSAQSEDRVPGPLTDIWSWEAGPFKSSRPFGSVAVWGGRLFTFSSENSAHHLVSVDARTGARLWQQPLQLGATTAAARPDVGPAVTQDGLVYAHGVSPLTHGPELRSYLAADGRQFASQPLLTGGLPIEANLFVYRVFLLHGTRASMVIPPGPRAHWNLKRPFTMGPLLMHQGDLVALTWNDLVVRWRGSSSPEYTRLAHYSPNYKYLDLTPYARFEGYPSAATEGGLVVADDSTRRFVGVVSPGRAMAWHWDIPWTVGIPSTAAGRIFLGIGGPGARGGLTALKSNTGEPLWMYPRLGPPPDPQVKGNLPDDYRISHVVNGLPIHPYSLPGAAYKVNESSQHREGRRSYQPGSEPVGHDTKLASHGRPADERTRGAAGINPGSSVLPPVLSVEGLQEVMRCPTIGHLANIGLVTAQQRVYGWIATKLVCLDQATGLPVWIRDHPHYHPITDLVATQEELILCQDRGTLPTAPATLWGLDLNTGRLKWSLQIPKAGRLAVGHGILYLNTGENITAYAPAERTFRMAIDSPVRTHYHPDPAGVAPPEPADGPEPLLPQPEGEGAMTEAPKPMPEIVRPHLFTEVKPPRAASGLADATLLRLRFDQPLEALLRQARERRIAAGEVPRVLVLDWLTPDRRNRLRADGHGSWGPETVRDFIHSCERLAAEFRPDHFELAPDVNVYLSHHSRHVEEVRSMLRAAGAAIRKVSPDTKTLISYNAEVLSKTYGRAKYFPFGSIPEQPDSVVQQQLTLLEEVDEVGLTTHPQSGNIGSEQVLPAYFHKLVARFGEKPLLVTRIGVRVDDQPPTGPDNQAKFLKRITRALYWLNARIVAYPDLVGDGESETALKAGEEERPALTLWKDMLRWKRVKDLTASSPARSR